MIGFCGALNLAGNSVSFAVLKRMSGLHSAGCAFINEEFGILCDCAGEQTLQPVTLSYNGYLYTAAIVAPASMCPDDGNVAQGILEGYFELGEEFINRLDFPYALALYDGRRGELLLAKGHRGDKALFYTVRDETLYFASSIRPLIRLYGGCVYVSEKILLSHLTSNCQEMPNGLFSDIHLIRHGQSLFCSRLGYDIIPTPCGAYTYGKTEKAPKEASELSKRTDMRRILTDALFAFGYPQFDCFMPSVLSCIKALCESGTTEICFCDALKNDYGAYALERAERIGEFIGTELYSAVSEKSLPSKKELKFIDAELDKILEEYLVKPQGMFLKLTESGIANVIKEQTNLPLRIRQKGMLIQTAMWFDTYNIVLN